MWIWAHYDELDDQTVVVFDKQRVFTSTTWIRNVPSTICIYLREGDGNCDEINDKAKITAIADLINNAIDWEEGTSPRERTSIVDFGTISVRVLYESDKEIYFVSEQGTKLMKPEREFFELTNLPR
ncbi:hypothetical protein [Paenibacillus alkalitolerans]|uniref:hypothetical protein n=1 Tax=Paenibacillus alkalitolerans TaxID=2799335 RepID=UPI0018F58F1B|nr:hypothetical protein [Paenibacillus alkalitolerans]